MAAHVDEAVDIYLDVGVVDDFVDIDFWCVLSCTDNVSYQKAPSILFMRFWSYQKKEEKWSTATKLTGQTLFAAWGINPNDKLELPTRKYNKSELTTQSFKRSHALVNELCDALKNKSKIKDLDYVIDCQT